MQNDKTPDVAHSPPSQTTDTVTPKISFRDKVLGDKPIPPPLPKRDQIAEELMFITYQDGNPLLPQVKLDPRLLDNLYEPWRDALVIKLLEKTVGYRVMKERLQRLWKLQGGFEILDVDNGYFMVKFDLQSDKETVTRGGP